MQAGGSSWTKAQDLSTLRVVGVFREGFYRGIAWCGTLGVEAKSRAYFQRLNSPDSVAALTTGGATSAIIRGKQTAGPASPNWKGEIDMATSFAADIKPYFTQLDRDQMMDGNHTGGYTLDLWSLSDVENNWDLINSAVSGGSMPPPPPDSDGPWAQSKIDQFVKDFQAWQDGGYQP
jgi:hypothetical protein